MIYVLNSYFYQTPSINWQQDRFYASKHFCSIDFVSLRPVKSYNVSNTNDTK